MKLSSGVEWAVHACGLLSALPVGKALSADALAAYYELPTDYMRKQMQALSKVGLVSAHRGKHGGYALARAAGAISLWDVVAAVEGAQPAFRCTEIRRKGPCRHAGSALAKPCAINAAFLSAERVYRDALASTFLADINAQAAKDMGADRARQSLQWLFDQANDVKPAPR